MTEALLGATQALLGATQAFVLVFSVFVIVLIVLIAIVIRWAFRRDKELRRAWAANRSSPQDPSVVNEDGHGHDI